jgi:hypothetical protein
MSAKFSITICAAPKKQPDKKCQVKKSLLKEQEIFIRRRINKDRMNKNGTKAVAKR